MAHDPEQKRRRFHFLAYARQERRLVAATVVLSLALATSLWLVKLNEAGIRLATIGAFIVTSLAFILPPILKHFAEEYDQEVGDREPKSAWRDISIVAVSAILAIVVAITVGWIIQKTQLFVYRQLNSDPAYVTIRDNKQMSDGDVATLTLPDTQHQHLKLTLKLLNNKESTTTCNSATIHMTGVNEPIPPGESNQERIIKLQGINQQRELRAQLKLHPEIAASCTLDIELVSATYFK